MPEYLAPGVYVEEIDTGNKPIEGVSTSTAGIEGLTERGPVNVPILVTSYGQYARWFGGYLPIDEFSNPTGAHCYLPHAVEGFFTNGGKRAFIVRVTGEGALPATQDLFDRGAVGAPQTLILRAAAESTGSVANPPLLYVLDPTGLSDVAPNNWIRIGDGSPAEYQQIVAFGTVANNTHVPLNLPLNFLHESANTVQDFASAPAAGYGAGFTLSVAASQGEITIVVTGAAADLSKLQGSAGQILEIGGAFGEHHFAQSATISGTAATVILEAPLAMSYAAAASVNPLAGPSAPPPPPPLPVLTLNGNTGDSLIFVDNRGGVLNDHTHLVFVAANDPARNEVRRIGNLFQVDITPNAYEEYPVDAIVKPVMLVDDDRHLTVASVITDKTITLDDVSSLSAGDTVLVDVGLIQESKVIQSVNAGANQISFATGLANAHALAAPVTPTLSLKTMTSAAPAGSRVVALGNRISLSVGDVVRVGTAPQEEYATIVGIPNRSPAGVAPDSGNVVLDHALVLDHPSGDALRRQFPPTLNPIQQNGAAAPPAAPVLSTAVLGALAARTYFVVLTYFNPLTGETTISPRGSLPIPANDVLVVTSPAAETGVTQYKVYASTVSGSETLQATLNIGVNWTEPAAGLVAGVPFPTANTASTPVTTVLVLKVDQGDATLLLSDGSGYAAAASLSVTIPTGETFYHAISAAGAAGPVEVTLQNPLERAHPAGSLIVPRNPLILVQALDVGAWGNRLRISVQDESPGLVSRTTLATIINPTHIRLASAAGVEAGTILELLDPLNNDAVVDTPLKVVLVDRNSNNTITLQSALTGAQMTAQANAVAASKALGVRSREFRVTVYLLHQPDPALPARDNAVIDTEVFRNLSMDSRHSRYVQTIIGDINGPLRLEDRRPEGQSWYVRVHDLAQDILPDPRPTLESVRLGPETLVDILPSGAEQPARQALEHGDDAVNTVDDHTYMGDDNADPEQRTGLFSLVSVEEVSILAVPGRTTPAVQQALIDQCETLRYRFAVLDGPPPPNDSIADVQNQRQQFDTEYAALYHPWLLIEDPFPTNLQQIANFPIPPSGNVMGVYARTDDTRGVHKAPANEVVNGIIGLQRTLYKGEQDILNPYPVNINVIRDFRKDNRSIRIWGARVITSDPDWIYVNVRRLMIFLEQSMDLGLQWVVFELNAEPLWARVKRTITNFLTTAWRNGALEGTKPEEAFFVKCDATTMTQDDIDNGRLIVVIGVAPVRPAEFVIIRIGLWTAGSQT
jgi:phage tail sheath protein FI